MRFRFLLLPHTGTWCLVQRLDTDMIPEGAIVLDAHQANPARRMLILQAGSWTALTEADIDRHGLADLPSPMDLPPLA